MRVLQINSVYKSGSTGNIVFNIHQGLIDEGVDSFVCFGRGKKTNEKNVYKVSTELEAKIHSLLAKFFGGEYRYSFFSTRKLIRLILKIKPDIVHIHCLNCHFVNAYKLLSFLRDNNVVTVLTLHAEIMHTAGCEHAFLCEKWKTIGCKQCSVNRGLISRLFRDDAHHNFALMQKCVNGFRTLNVVGVSQYITSRAKESIIFCDKPVTTITNGIDTSVFKYRFNEDLRKQYSKYKRIVLHVTPSFDLDIKGGRYFEELAKRIPEYAFIVVGSKKESSIDNLFFVGHTKDQRELAEYYSIADCFAMTSKRETYPTVCLEAASCGCNIVGFETGGVKETIPIGMGECVKPYDLDLFSEAIIKWSNIDNHTKNTFIKDKKGFVDDHLRLYKRLLGVADTNGKY